MRKPSLTHTLSATAAAGVLAVGMSFSFPAPGPTASVIVQGDSYAAVRRAIAEVGGTLTHELDIINAAGVEVTPAQLRKLGEIEGLRIHADAGVETAGGPVPDAEHVKLIGADTLHAQGYTGSGVTVAVLDTGMWYSHNHIKRNLAGDNKIIAQFDAIENAEVNAADKHGHGTHLTSIIASSQISDNGNVHGIAPDVNLVNVKAFDVNGASTYADVIRGLDWVVDNKDAYDIRVLNLSFSATPQSHYWDDPLNQAVMKAWEA